MILYLDTSAYLKIFINELESAVVRTALGTATSVFTHLITYTEMRAALAKAYRMGRVDNITLEQYKRDLAADWQQLEVVMPTEEMIRRAGDLAEHFGLRGYDSIHLAVAEAVFRLIDSPDIFRFAVFDNALMTAATMLGIPILE